ncbi:Terpene cyclase [Mycena sanguinolenta]|uniref:Terpene synthase n=1 Tax=Mycena sanguinolenta TaxID=230812 RepID=A0A8H6YU99_9AGAR|nr:Terpene cyclase [Mycena sanguinolenta]
MTVPPSHEATPCSAVPCKVAPTSFILPDLFSHSRAPSSPEKQRKALRGLKAGELTGYCYPTTSPERLRVISDFLTYLFHLDNVSDGMMTRDTEVLADSVMNALWLPNAYRPTSGAGKKQPSDELNAGKAARDFWARCIPDAGAGPQARFKETLGMFFEAVNMEAYMRDTNCIPDIESYIAIRRDTSGCYPCWAMIEYALDIELPDFVAEDPVIKALERSTNDLVTWSNDIFSYNVEQSRGDTQNMIIILMKYHGYTLQSAVDYVGELCRSTIETFQRDRVSVPYWGPEIQEMVERYVQGLESWMVGSLHWSFKTERYFGKSAADVKNTRIVTLRSPS